MELLPQLSRFVRKSPREMLWSVCSNLAEMDWYWKAHSPGNDRTAYLIGLFGSGRDYLNDQIFLHLGKRGKYLRQGIRWRQVRTSVIYSGHATIRHLSRGQSPPSLTRHILEGARSGSVDLIFICRHPLDSLLSNWVYWRSSLRGPFIPRISEGYKSIDDLCADLERNFAEFKAFVDGDPGFFAGSPGPRFLSFREYVEETDLFLESASLFLRLEDFAVDPPKEFSKLARLLAIELDLSHLRLARPLTKPFRHLLVRKKVPQFAEFIAGLDTETKGRIERFGYDVFAE